ncbi:DEAD/DEAH box helicase family protein [Nitrosomonas ureae]|nr:DEAD/DEAH box helicase family protein [Nitrosomonas ureae]
MNREKFSFFSIKSIIDRIRSDEFKDLVTRVRKSTDESKKELKLKLHAFYPNFHFENDSPEAISPSGIIGYDLDLKHQDDGFDVVKLKEIIITLPSCLYAYISPSGGLKFGIKTDFIDSEGEDSSKERFKIAYKLILDYLIDNIAMKFVCDSAASSIKLLSYFSYDPNAYLNLDCEEYPVSDACIYEPHVDYIPNESTHSREDIIELLQWIPALSYEERLPINCAVIKCLGAEGIGILVDHWVSKGKSREKILKQIRNQEKHVQYGSIGHLINVAKRYGYSNAPTGRARNGAKPRKSKEHLQPLFTVEEGNAKLLEAVQEFFTQRNNVFINVSAGAGKSTAVLNILAKTIPYNKKVLFLVPTHKLASELESKFKEARNRPDIDKFESKHGFGNEIQNKGFESFIVRLKTIDSPLSGVVHLYGKDKLCVNTFAINAFEGASNIPFNYCIACSYATECSYIQQFHNRLDNIRIMTHNEWKYKQSGWFSGYEENFNLIREIMGTYVMVNEEYLPIVRDDFGSYVRIDGRKLIITDGYIKLNHTRIDVSQEYIYMDDEYINVTNDYIEDVGDIYPSKDRWKPDYIIIDENVISVDLARTVSDDGKKHDSIRHIINSVNTGKSLKVAVKDNVEKIVSDDCRNTKPKYPLYKNNIEKYKRLVASTKEELKSYSIFLERMISYLKTDDEKYLQGMWVGDNKLHYAPVSHASKHYEQIPTLFLDATANAEVVRATLGNIKFHSISIQSKSDINLFQLANFTVTKLYLGEAKNRKELVEWLKSIIEKEKYKKVGLISYIQAKGIEGNFDKFLADEVGAQVYDHFGALRGIDAFDEVDCLLIVGRHFVGEKSVSELSAAIFGELEKYEKVYADMPTRMKDGSKYLVNSNVQVNGKHLAVNEHFSLSETKQAIGRARTIHGKNKDIYLFSNESLGLDIEVTDFFYRRAKETITCSDDLIQKIKSIGYVLNIEGALLNIGFSQRDVKSRRARILEKLAENDIHLMQCNMIDAIYRKSVVEYLIADKSIFIAEETYDSKKFQSFVEEGKQ